jgi:hypothetical protein
MTDGVDISALHRELDRLKVQLCRCNHQGECIACRGFETLREQSQMVVAAASQPVLMQVAQDVAVKDLMERLGGLQGKLSDDIRLQELMGEMMQRVQDDLGGPEEMQKMFGMFGMPGAPGGFAAPPAPDDAPPGDEPHGNVPYDDRPHRPPAGGDPPSSP